MPQSEDAKSLDEVTKALEEVHLPKEEEEEEIIVGLKSGNTDKEPEDEQKEKEDEEEGHYTSKGPIRNGGVMKVKPYVKPNDHYGGGLDDLLMMGQFLDEITVKQEPGEEAGIPGLPGDAKSTNLVDCLDDFFGTPSGSGSRIVVRDVRGNSGMQVLPTTLSIILDEHQRRIGLNIPKQILPTCAIPMGMPDHGGKLEAYLQLDPKMTRVIKITANIERTTLKGKECWILRSQFLHLQPFLGQSAISVLLDGVSQEEIQEANGLVQRKTTEELIKTYGPNEDTTLMILCSQKATSKLRAQILFVVKKLLAHPDPVVRRIVVRKNKVGSSALDFACLTNKPEVTRFLAELFYDMGEDLFCPDSAGNTILHVLARKGDEVAPILQTLLSLRFHGERKVYPSDIRNNKLELPIHIAAKSQKCHHRILQLLYKDMPQCLSMTGEEGNLALHYACQYSKDHALLATLLFYDKLAINARRDDGFTGLHLIVARSDVNDPNSKLFPLAEDHQIQMIKVMIDHGADVSARVEDQYTPADLHTANRKAVLDLLKPRSSVGGASPAASSGYGGDFVMSPQDFGGVMLGGGGQPSPFSNGSISSGHGSDTEDHEIVPQLVEVLYQHPTIQAVIDGDDLFQELLNQ